MKNLFVDYLNSLHNDNAGNQNAIGEMQISNPFFSKTQVKRGLIAFLANKVRSGAFIILTGHAGDGKTTLLAQVMNELGCCPQTLAPSEDVIAGEISLHYVKDFTCVNGGRVPCKICKPVPGLITVKKSKEEPTGSWIRKNERRALDRYTQAVKERSAADQETCPPQSARICLR